LVAAATTEPLRDEHHDQKDEAERGNAGQDQVKP
jgi:hypothetical protein